MNQLFILPAFYNSHAVEELRRELKGKRFKIKITNRSGGGLVGKCSEFKNPIHLPQKLIDEFYLKTNMSLEAHIALQQGPGGRCWRFTAQEMEAVIVKRSPQTKHKPNPVPSKPLSERIAVKTPAPAWYQENTLPELSDHQIRTLQKAGKAIQNRSFSPQDETSICIYIDESTLDTQTGAIAGIAWISHEPIVTELPFIENHILQGGGYMDPDKISEAIQALCNLGTASRAFPFVLTLTLPDDIGIAQQNYEYQILTSLRLLFRWLLPQSPTKTTPVHIFLEQYAQYAEGLNVIKFIEGLLKSASRFSTSFKIHTVKYVGKTFQYIPYADLLAYIVQKGNPISGQMAENFQLEKLPGFLNVTRQLIADLDKLDAVHEGSMTTILNLLGGTENSFLDKSISLHLKKVFSNNRSLRPHLLAALEERFRDKTPDLSLLRRLTNKVFFVVGEPDESTPDKTRLMHTLIAIQNANHHGQPEAAQALREGYAIQRSLLLEANRELVTYTDLNMAVSYADTFDFGTSLGITQNLVNDPLFEALSPHMKGRARSAQGQYLSLTGEPELAEASFSDALAEFSKPGLDRAQEVTEKLQTCTYGTINALNYEMDSWKTWASKIFSYSPEQIQRISADNFREEQYIHHLLLRIFWYRQEEEVQKLKKDYLTFQKNWTSYQHHPWELICLYRGIFLAKEDVDNASKWFQQALDICKSNVHGSILQLIGAMIATVALCATGKPIFKQQAEELLLKVRPELPRAASVIQSLTAILEAPSEASIGQALKALPFNYH